MKSFKTKPTKVRGIGNLFSERKNTDYITEECSQEQLNTLHPFEGINQLEYELSNTKTHRKIVLTVDKSQVLLLDYIKLTATVTDDTGAPISGALVSFYREDSKCANDATLVTNENGVAIYNYLVNENQANIWFFIAKTNVTIDSKDIQLMSNAVIVGATKRPVLLSYPDSVKQNTSYTGRLTDKTTGNGITNQKIILRISRLSGETKSYTLTTDKEGYFTFPQITLAVGTYNFVIVYDGTSVYENIQTDMFQVDVNTDKRQSNITEITDTIIRYSYFQAKLIDSETEQPLPEQMLTVEMIRTTSLGQQSKSYQMVTDENGYFKQILELTEGEYTFNISYLGNDKYEPSSQTNIKIIVTPSTQIETRINTAISVTRNDTYKGVLTDILGQGIEGKNILIHMYRLKNGVETSKTYGTGETIDGILDPYIKTDTNGIFNKLITLPSTSSCQCQYFFDCEFEGDDTFKKSRTGKQEVTILADEKRKSQIIPPDSVIRYTDYIGVLRDYESENGLPNKKVNLTMTNANGVGKTYAITTNEKGEFHQYIELTPGIYTFTASFDGDDDYNPTSYGPQQVSVIEKKDIATLTLENTSVVYTENMNFILKDSKNVGIKDKNILVTMKKHNSTTNEDTSKDYNVITNSDGIASVPITLDIAENLTYYVSAKFIEDQLYTSSTIPETQFIINPLNTHLALTSDVSGSVDLNSNVHFIATLTDDNGNPISDATINLLEDATEIISTTTTLTSNKASMITSDSATLTATVKDSSNNLLSGIIVEFFNGNSSLGTATTNSSGVATKTFSSTTNQTAVVTATTTATDTYSSSTSSSVTITVSSYLYAPTLDGTESVTAFSGYSAPTISNNVLVNGAGYLTDGWSNSGNWEISFDFKLGNSTSGIILCSNSATGYDNNSIQIILSQFSIRNGTTMYLNKSMSLSSGTWYSATIRKEGTAITYTIGSVTGTSTWTGQSSITTMAIGNYYWSSASSNLKNIKVTSI